MPKYSMIHENYKHNAGGRFIDKLEFSGVCDWDGFYELMAQFFIQRRYIFTEKVNKFLRGKSGFNYEIELEAWRKVTPYFKYWQELYIRIWDKEPVEVIKDGQKKQLYRIRFMIEFKPSIETDYNKRFEKSEFMEKVRGWIEKYLLKREIEFRHWDDTYYEAIKLRDEMKSFLNMQTLSGY